MTILIGSILYALAASASSYTTARGIAAGAREKNPALAWIMSKIGTTPALLITKLIGGVCIGLAGRYFGLGGWPLAAVAAVLAFIAWRNWKVAKRLEGKG